MDKCPICNPDQCILDNELYILTSLIPTPLNPAEYIITETESRSMWQNQLLYVDFIDTIKFFNNGILIAECSREATKNKKNEFRTIVRYYFSSDGFPNPTFYTGDMISSIVLNIFKLSKTHPERLEGHRIYCYDESDYNERTC